MCISHTLYMLHVYRLLHMLNTYHIVSPISPSSSLFQRLPNSRSCWRQCRSSRERRRERRSFGSCCPYTFGNPGTVTRNHHMPPTICQGWFHRPSSRDGQAFWPKLPGMTMAIPKRKRQKLRCFWISKNVGPGIHLPLDLWGIRLKNV